MFAFSKITRKVIRLLKWNDSGKKNRCLHSGGVPDYRCGYRSEQQRSGMEDCVRVRVRVMALSVCHYLPAELITR